MSGEPQDLSAVAEVIQVSSDELQEWSEDIGPWPSIGLGLGIFTLCLASYVFLRSGRIKEERKRAERAEADVQRLAAANRELRLLVYKDHANWTPEELERLMIGAEFPTPKDARTSMEGGQRNPPTDEGEASLDQDPELDKLPLASSQEGV